MMKKMNLSMIIGLIIIVMIIGLIIATPFMELSNPNDVDPANRLKSSSAEHLLGTDFLGRDILSRTLQGFKLSIFIAFMVTMISTVAGLVLGTLAAYNKYASNIIMRVMDGIMAFPTIILAIALAGILGAGVSNIIISLTISYFPTIVRLVKNEVLNIKNAEFVESYIVLGKSKFYIISKIIWPNIMSPILVQTTFIFAMAILNESILSFLGVGIKAPAPSLGGTVNDGRNYMIVAPWTIVYPGLTISMIVLGLNMFGDGLRDYFDPKKQVR